MLLARSIKSDDISVGVYRVHYYDSTDKEHFSRVCCVYVENGKRCVRFAVGDVNCYIEDVEKTKGFQFMELLAVV